jgi:hypothetical protein
MSSHGVVGAGGAELLRAAQQRPRCGRGAGGGLIAVFGAGGQDALDGPIRRVATARARAQAASSRSQPYLSRSPSTPCAERRWWIALSRMNSAITAWQAGPTSAAMCRHQVGFSWRRRSSPAGNGRSRWSARTGGARGWPPPGPFARATSSAKCVAIHRRTDDSDTATSWSSRSRCAILATVTSPSNQPLIRSRCGSISGHVTARIPGSSSPGNHSAIRSAHCSALRDSPSGSMPSASAGATCLRIVLRSIPSDCHNCTCERAACQRMYSSIKSNISIPLLAISALSSAVC